MQKKRKHRNFAPVTTNPGVWPRRLMSAALLAFVAVCVIALAMKHLHRGAAPAELPLPDDGLVVCYLHSNTRCEDCENLERGARAAVEAGLAEGQLASGVVFRSINYERQENKPLVDRYELVAPTVVLVRRVGGKETAWKSLPEAWDLRGDPQQLREFLLREIRRFQESK